MDLEEHWPVLVGVAIIAVGHVWMYGFRGEEWHPVSPPLLIAVVVVLAIELGRWIRSNWA